MLNTLTFQEAQELRKNSLINNLTSVFAQKFLKLFICPICKTPLTFEASGEKVVCENKKHIIENGNGFLDFTNFSRNALQEKEAQASSHDAGEDFFHDIVLRPYNGNAVHIESWLYHLKYFHNRLKLKLGITLQNTTILNCGCGGGFEAQFFAEQGALVVGFDISKLRVEAALTRFNYKNLSGLFYRGDASMLPFSDKTFDLVIYHDSLHHVPIEEIPLAIREAARVAKKGVILLEANDSSLRMLLETMGLSSSIEGSGNYVFRFKKSLMEFWASQNSMTLVDYSVLFTKKEHNPGIYSIPVIGWIVYKLVRFVGLFLKPLGNEACIIYKK